MEIIGRKGMYTRYQPNLMGDILDIKISVSDSLAKVYIGFKSVSGTFQMGFK